MRRVTTGLDARGRSTVISDEQVDGDPRATVLWGTDAAPTLRPDGAPPAVTGWWPPAGGVRVSFCQRAPDRVAPRAAAPQDWPDIHDAQGFHASSSIDIIAILSGEIVLELDDRRVVLRAGDWLIQNGTRHRWANETPEPVTMAVIVVGAIPVPPQPLIG